VSQSNAEIIVIGDELLSGETIDTNSSYLDGHLERLGWTVVRHTTVADETEQIAQVIESASRRSQLVLCSGGLGPTRDDLTLEALAKALGCGLRQDKDVLASIEAKFQKIGRTMSPNNARQSIVPEIGEVIENPVGTAPCFSCSLNGAEIYLLPGVPRELKWLFTEIISPRIDLGGGDITRRTLKVIGLGESRLEHTIRDIVKRHRAQVTFGFRALGAENHIKLMGRGPKAPSAIQLAENELRENLGDLVFGSDDELLTEVLGRLLIKRNETMALAESCTGGLMSKLLTDVSGSSAYVLGGCVTYSDDAKQSLLDVPGQLIEVHGAVSTQVAEAMAVGIRKRLNSTWALSATGIAGPSGGTEEKPIGTVCLGLAGPHGVQSSQKHMIGNREGIRQNTALALFDMLRKKLL
jgi:nicotinamide-nucleotide amidase